MPANRKLMPLQICGKGTDNGGLLQEQMAIFVLHQGEWIVVIDCDEDEPERTWKYIRDAVRELQGEGWKSLKGHVPSSPHFQN